MTDNAVPDEEHAMAQIDEVMALSMIYDDDLRMISGPTDDLDDFQAYDYPISYSVRLSAALNLHVEYPSAYPDVAPRLALLEARSQSHSIDYSRRLLEAVQNQAEIEVGMPCVMQCIQAGREFIEGSSFEATDTTCSIDSRTCSARPDDVVTKESTNQSEIDPFDTIPRPLLNIILNDFCNVKDRSRLSIASKFIRTIIERRSHKLLGTSIHVPVEVDDWNELRSTMTIDGVRRQHWELDVIRAKEERKVLSNHELLWRRQRTRKFTLSSETDSWWVCEGLPDEADQAAGHVNRHWIFQNYSFHYARVSKPISFDTEHWYVVRVRLRACRAEDGDIFVGLACEQFDDTPAELFRTIPGGGFGAVSEQCAFINVISAQNSPDGHPMEINFGLKVQGASVYGTTRYIAYAIPRGTFRGRPMYNDGTVLSKIPNSGNAFYEGACQVPVFLAVVSARSVSQSDFHAHVIAEECSEKEYNRLFEEPYNYL
jgi:hypothetical protein